MSHSVRKHAWSDSNSNGLSISIQNKDVDIYVDNIYCVCVCVCLTEEKSWMAHNIRKIFYFPTNQKKIIIIIKFSCHCIPYDLLLNVSDITKCWQENATEKFPYVIGWTVTWWFYKIYSPNSGKICFSLLSHKLNIRFL